MFGTPHHLPYPLRPGPKGCGPDVVVNIPPHHRVANIPTPQGMGGQGRQHGAQFRTVPELFSENSPCQHPMFAPEAIVISSLSALI